MDKRIFDFVFSLVALLLLSPLFVVIAIIIKVDGPGPVFYRGCRTGFHGKPFKMYKFRTMVPDAEKLGGPSTGLNDLRLTKAGKVLRRFKLDELPQLINVLKGEMSIVGPRPQVERYTKLYGEKEKIIFSVKPGLTDYASVRFIDLDRILGDDRVDEKYFREIEPEKNRLRVKYAREHSFRIDMKIIWMTVVQLSRIHAAWNIRD